MLYQIMLFDGSFVDVLEDEAKKAGKLIMEGKHILVQGTLLSPKAVASIKPYTRDFFHGDYVTEAKFTERELLDKRAASQKMETSKPSALISKDTLDE